MVEEISSPLSIYVVALGVGFLLPVLSRLGREVGVWVFMLALAAMAGIAGLALWAQMHGAPAVEIETAGVAPPFSINLRFGLYEGGFTLAVNLAALLAAWHLLGRLRDDAAAMLLYVILVMGVDGMVMTRDLFNLFIFIEITALATYGVLGVERSGKALAAAFKYIIATSLASTFFLLGTVLLYFMTGTLNIDDLVAKQALIVGPIGVVAGILLLTSVLIELKPYPANGWGLDVYETAPTGIASLVSVGVSAGALFAMYKVMAVIPNLWPAVAVVGGITFLVSNIIGLKQDHVRRLLGYSSIGQMGLLALAVALLEQAGLQRHLPLVVGGLFINHLLAKAGLFWLAGQVGRDELRQWSALAGRPLLLLLLGALLAALVGFPPFPGFWGKWGLIMDLGRGGQYGWMLLVLAGSLLEAAYLFRWLGYALRPDPAPAARAAVTGMGPVIAAVALLLGAGLLTARASGATAMYLYLPLYAGAVLLVLDGLPGRIKAVLSLVLVAGFGYWLLEQLEGLPWLFCLLLVGGGVVVALGTLYRNDDRPGYYPLLTVMLMSLGALVASRTTLEFFFSWEVMTLSSYLLIGRGREAVQESLIYLLFSLGAAFFILAGFAVAYGATGSNSIAALGQVGAAGPLVLALVGMGFVIKTGGFGVHVWLPGSYAESEDDFSAILSSVVGKAGIFGLLMVGAHLGLASKVGLNPGYLLGWVGLLTATFGALMAVFQEDVKRLLAYSSMGQVGYIVGAGALMSHLGWVTAIYLTVNHFLYKAILFLAIAGVIHRTGTRLMYRMGGLINNMPFSYIGVLVAIIAMSGVPPLTGFGGKWLLLNALMEQHWYYLAALAFFSSGVAFLYLFRLIHTVFLGQRKREHKDIREASAALILPQFLLIAVIMAISVWPKLLIEPVSTMLAPYFAGTITWVGGTAHTALGYWNATLVMAVTAGVMGVPLLVLLFMTRYMRIQRVKQFNIVFAAERPDRPETTHYAYNFFSFYDRALGYWVRPRATAFWRAVSEWAHSAGASLRVLYTGNGQTYALLIVTYLVALYLATAGMR